MVESFDEPPYFTVKRILKELEIRGVISKKEKHD
jgi:hypothetical protein